MRSGRSDHVIVVGAGIAGLAAAHRLAEAGLRVNVLEAARCAGGRMATRALGDGLMETGAQFLSTGYDVIPGLLRAAGLEGQAVTVSGRTLLVGGGRSHRFDTGRPLSMLVGGPLRLRDLAAAARGMWSTRKLAGRPSCDLGGWADLDGQNGLEWGLAHFGPGLTERVFNPTVRALYFQELAANSAALTGALAGFSARASSPSTPKSSTQKSSTPNGRLRAVTLRGGLGQLTTALAAALDVDYEVHVERVQRPDRPGAPVVVVTSRGAREAGWVVIATPAAPTAGMLADPTRAESALLRTPYSCGLVVGLGLAEPLHDGELGGAYGVMVMPDCPSPLAAVAVYSRADRSAGGEVLTVMFHQGATRLLTAADDATVRAAAIDAVTPWLPGLASRVIDSHVTRWPEAMPYVPVGHASTVRRYRDTLPAGSPVLLAGDYLGFPWSDSAAFNGRWAADQLLHSGSVELPPSHHHNP